MALSSIVKQPNYRSSKVLREFVDSYLSGRLNVTPEDFITAKQDEFHSHNLNIIGPISFELIFLGPFYVLLKEYEETNGTYHVGDLMAAWERTVED